MVADNQTESLYRSLVTRVVWSQVIWTAGYSLTTGPFLSYFGQDLGATGRVAALLLILPETAGILGLFSRTFIRRFHGRKRVWIVFSLLARGLSLGIPLAGIPAMQRLAIHPLWLLVASLALSQAAQAVSYVAYVAWLADAVPSTRWGRFFALRNIGELSVLLVVPVLAGASRDWWKRHASPEMLTWAYVAAFAIGVTLLLASMVPLLAIREQPASRSELRVGNWERFRQAFSDRSLRCLLIHNWWLAAANGLTQAAFFRYLFGPLKLELGWIYVLDDVRIALGIPLSWMTGVIADRRGNKWPMIVGVVVASSSLWFWIVANPIEWWWLFGAYACWAAFQTVNITGRNLVLKLSPDRDNAAAMALFRQVGGLLAGLSGLCGGFWLDRLTTRSAVFNLGFGLLDSYQLLFAISLLGRLTSVFWLLPIREPAIEAKHM